MSETERVDIEGGYSLTHLWLGGVSTILENCSFKLFKMLGIVAGLDLIKKSSISLN